MQQKQPENLLTLDECADALSVSKNRVRRLIEENYLVPLVKDGVAFISSDFIVDGRPLASLRGTLILLSDVGLTQEQSYEWLYTYNEDLQSEPITELLKGHKAPVRRVAQMAAE